jgi:hypothetical protein
MKKAALMGQPFFPKKSQFNAVVATQQMLILLND